MGMEKKWWFCRQWSAKNKYKNPAKQPHSHILKEKSEYYPDNTTTEHPICCCTQIVNFTFFFPPTNHINKANSKSTGKNFCTSFPLETTAYFFTFFLELTLKPKFTNDNAKTDSVIQPLCFLPHPHVLLTPSPTQISAPFLRTCQDIGQTSWTWL